MRFSALLDKDLCGFFTFRNPEESMDVLRFGFVIIAPDRRSVGLGKEMLRLGLEYAFGIYGAKKVSIGVFEDNLPAYRCYSSLGFLPTGIKESYTINSVERTAIEMEISESDWKK